jgi:hypothetical protein
MVAPADVTPTPQHGRFTLADIFRTAAQPPTPPRLTPPNRLRAEALAMSCLAGLASERAFAPLAGRCRVAAHEAAHAVADYFIGADVTKVSIIPPDAVVAGYVLHVGTEFRDSIPIPGRTFVSSDERMALLMLRLGAPDANWKKLRALMRIARHRADDLVAMHKPVIQALADRLLQIGTMDGAEARAVIEAAIRARGLARLKELGVATRDV